MYINGWNKNTLQIAHGSEGIGKNNSPRAEEENFRESLLRKIGMEGVQGVREVPVRGLAYEECDRVKINVLEGYTVKIKLEEKKASRNMETCDTDVYIEMKWDNGDKRAGLYALAALKKNGNDIMEKIAYEMLNIGTGSRRKG